MGELISYYYPGPEAPDLPRSQTFNVLTSRRREVLIFSALGLSNSEIGQLTGTSGKAVKGVQEDTRRLFDASSMTEAVLTAVERGDLDLDRLTVGIDLTRIESLTPGERRVLLAMDRNGSRRMEQKEIAEELDLAPVTIKSVQRRIYTKLGTNGSLQTRLYLMRARKEGILPQSQAVAEIIPNNP